MKKFFSKILFAIFHPMSFLTLNAMENTEKDVFDGMTLEQWLESRKVKK